MSRRGAPIGSVLVLAFACGNATGLRVDGDEPAPEPQREPAPARAMAPAAGSAAEPESTIDCAAVTVRVDRVTPKVMLLVDGSASMQDNVYPAGGDTTRWDALRASLLDERKGVVPAMQGLLKFGLAIYGSGMTRFGVPSAKQCPFPLGIVAPALNGGEAIDHAWPALPPGNFTPTGEALELVLRTLADWRAGAAAEPEVIVLATDGNPNGCRPQQITVPDYQPTIDAALHARAEHVKLYVISLGTDADREHLQQIANIGAGFDADAEPAAPLYYPEDAEELTATLRQLLGSELSCELRLDGDGVDPGKQCLGSVRLSGEPLACGQQDGFRVKDPLHVELLGAACARLRAAPDVSLEVSFPCEALLGEGEAGAR